MKQIKIKLNQKLYDCIEDYSLKMEIDEKSISKMLLFTGIINEKAICPNGVKWFASVPLSILNEIFGDNDLLNYCLQSTIELWTPENRNWQKLAFSIYPEYVDKNCFELQLNISNKLADKINKWL